MSDRIVGILLFVQAVVYGLTGHGYVSDFIADPLGPSAFPQLLAVLLGLASIYACSTAPCTAVASPASC